MSSTLAPAALWREVAARLGPGGRLVQCISDLVYGDAASTDLVQWRRTFEAAGIESPSYARRSDEHHAFCQPIESYVPQPNDLVLFHYTTWTESAERLVELGQPIVLMYHNVTPPEFFAGIDPAAEAATRRGRDELRRFAPLSPLAVAKSSFSERDLIEAGFATTGVVPVRIDFAALDAPHDEALRARVQREGPALLTVGRVVPSKRIEDVVKVFAYYRGWSAPTAHLYVVGAHDEGGAYQAGLRRLVRKLGIEDVVHFTGQVPNAQRGGYYRAARAFVTMSEHEGFCVPVVEAMHVGLPVVGYAGSAVPETMGNAGVLVLEKRHDAVAEAVGTVVAEGSLRQRLIEKGYANAARYRPEAIEADFARMLSGALHG